MTHPNLSVERRGHLLLMGINRPEKRNALTLEMYHALAQAYGELERDEDLRCGVVYGVGDHFTAGLELTGWVEAFSKGKLDVPEGGLDPFGVEGERLSKPLVAAAQGISFTVAIEMMLAADIRVAASDARFGQIEVKRGIYPVGGATVRFMYETGWGNAMRYLLTGDEFDAHEAHRIGFVQEVTDVGAQLERAIQIAERIAEQAPLGVYATLKSARTVMRDLETKALARLLPDLLPIMGSEDAREGVQSFIERRKANFKGR